MQNHPYFLRYVVSYEYIRVLSYFHFLVYQVLFPQFYFHMCFLIQTTWIHIQDEHEMNLLLSFYIHWEISK
jgi:hypothetical protein